MNEEENEKDLSDPLPIAQTEDDSALRADFPEGPTPETPVGAAMIWWLSLEDTSLNRSVLEYLSADPADWGDYTEPAQALRGLSILQNPIESPDRPGDLAYVKFIELAGDSGAQAFDDAELQDFWILTMVKGADRWLVWGMSHNVVPPASQVFGD